MAKTGDEKTTMTSGWMWRVVAAAAVVAASTMGKVEGLPSAGPAAGSGAGKARSQRPADRTARARPYSSYSPEAAPAAPSSTSPTGSTGSEAFPEQGVPVGQAPLPSLLSVKCNKPIYPPLNTAASSLVQHCLSTSSIHPSMSVIEKALEGVEYSVCNAYCVMSNHRDGVGMVEYMLEKEEGVCWRMAMGVGGEEGVVCAVACEVGGGVDGEFERYRLVKGGEGELEDKAADVEVGSRGGYPVSRRMQVPVQAPQAPQAPPPAPPAPQPEPQQQQQVQQQPLTPYPTQSPTKSAPTGTTEHGYASVFNTECTRLTNAHRARSGLPALAPSASAASSSVVQSQCLSDRPGMKLDHGYCGSLDERVDSLAWENIAWKSDMGELSEVEQAQVAVEMWWNSEGHQANILQPDATSVGCGLVCKQSQCWPTQIFLKESLGY